MMLAFCVGVGAVGLGLPDSARAGAAEWSFEVLDVVSGGGGTNLIRLRPAPPGKDFPRSCETFVVHSFYDIGDWSSAGRKPVTRTAHERSVQMLIQAQVTHTIVRIRSVGRGFGARPEAPRCEVTSRALSFAPDPGGIPVIFSFYEDPAPTR